MSTPTPPPGDASGAERADSGSGPSEPPVGPSAAQPSAGSSPSAGPGEVPPGEIPPGEIPPGAFSESPPAAQAPPAGQAPPGPAGQTAPPAGGGAVPAGAGAAGAAAAASGPQPTTAPPYAARSIADVFGERLDEEGFFSALFDMTFTRFVTRKLAGPVYIVGLTLIALGFVLAFISSISAAVDTGSAWGVLLFLLDLLLSVVGAMLSILLLRVGIEVFVAVVEIAENTRPRSRRRDN